MTNLSKKGCEACEQIHREIIAFPANMCGCKCHAPEPVSRAKESTPPTGEKEGWERWVRTLAGSTNPRDIDLLVVKVGILEQEAEQRGRKEAVDYIWSKELDWETKHFARKEGKGICEFLAEDIERARTPKNGKEGDIS